jgi:hypothetical protein
MEMNSLCPSVGVKPSTDTLWPPLVIQPCSQQWQCVADDDDADLKIVIDDAAAASTAGIASAVVTPVVLPAPVAYATPAPQLAYPQPNPYLPA